MYYKGDFINVTIRPGQGDLILLHGLLGSSQDFSILERMNRKNRLIKVDLPGHGGSSISRDPRDYRGLINHIIKTYRLEKPLVIGHSLGGSFIYEHLSLGYENILAGIVIENIPFGREKISVDLDDFLVSFKSRLKKDYTPFEDQDFERRLLKLGRENFIVYYNYYLTKNYKETYIEDVYHIFANQGFYSRREIEALEKKTIIKGSHLITRDNPRGLLEEIGKIQDLIKT